ncbi:phosphotransferase, partial [Streptomyces sp. SID3343]|uniref:phosphotransferase family protein n=1 Tax=Streptomyces sp. SID3343 TaxID=2690260 RepID=UPI00136BC8CB
PHGPERATIAGGVSARVVRIGDLVVKRPQRRLDVPFDWQAGTGRVLAEAAALRVAGDLAPAPLHVDELHHVLVQRFVAGEPWKDELLAGRVDPAAVAAVAAALATVHALPVDGVDGHDRFRRLRLVPYFLATARTVPELRPALTDVVERLTATRTHLVHGDLSPKNILVDRSGAAAGAVRVSVLDWEVVHAGDPAFDVAFLLSHLVAKGLHRPEAAEEFETAARTVRAACPDVDDAWLGRLLGALLLARVHGQSRLEYLDDAARARVDRRGRELLLEGEAPPC